MPEPRLLCRGCGRTLGEIAQAAGVGVRALMRGFEKRLGVSPVRYLLHWRLDRARGELLDAAPGTGTGAG